MSGTEEKKIAEKQKKTSPEAGGAAKKPYVAPAFRMEHVFETMALSCGKVYGSQLQCRLSRRSS